LLQNLLFLDICGEIQLCWEKSRGG